MSDRLLRIIYRFLPAVTMLLLVGCAHKEAPVTVLVRPPLHEKPHKATPKPPPLTGEALVNSLLPPKLVDRSGWAADIHAAFVANKIVPAKENVCAVVAEIEQESSFQADPVVPGLNKIVRHELETRRQKYHIPQWLMDNRLGKPSPDGKTYNERIAALKTENDVNILYQDIISEIPFGKSLLAGYNPVRTGGPMQVSISFASAHVAAQPYPYEMKAGLRQEVFSRKGGLYFGVAYLLEYPASYDKMEYRFADFNAGSYSSRNAAFQQAVSVLSGMKLQQDGDLLRYQDGVALKEPASQTMRALSAISQRLGLSEEEIYRDLLLEKTYAFEQSALYKKIYAMLPDAARTCIPQITLATPKASRKLTTANYVRQVKQRYQRCLSE